MVLYAPLISFTSNFELNSDGIAALYKTINATNHASSAFQRERWMGRTRKRRRNKRRRRRRKRRRIRISRGRQENKTK